MLSEREVEALMKNIHILSPYEEHGLEMVDLQHDPMDTELGACWSRAPYEPAFFKPQQPLSGEAKDLACRNMTAAWGTLKRLGQDTEWEPARVNDPDEWRAGLMADLPDPDMFRAGRLGGHVAVLEEYFRISGNNTKAAQQVVRWLKHGIYCKFVPVDSPGQEAMPFFRRKK